MRLRLLTSFLLGFNTGHVLLHQCFELHDLFGMLLCEIMLLANILTQVYEKSFVESDWLAAIRLVRRIAE